MDRNQILYLPFDDPKGDVAYDYSPSRKDCVLSGGASFSMTAKYGKSLCLNGEGECVTEQELPLDGNFTLCMYVYPSGDRLGWLLNFEGVDNYLEGWIDVVPKEWTFLAFVRNEKVFTVYHGTKYAYVSSINGNPVGFSINDESLLGTQALIDDLHLFKVAKTTVEIMQIQNDTDDVEYYIDGYNFKDFGVYVSKSSGLVGRLERKDPMQVEYEGYHGIVRVKSRPRFRERTITLSCFLEATGRAAYVERTQAFFELFNGAGNHRFVCEIGNKNKPLVYEVELFNSVDPEKMWSRYNDELMVGTFELVLVEDEPVKKVLRHVSAASGSTASVTVTSSKHLNIYWGDGTHTYKVYGKNVRIEHTYDLPGEYDIIIAGVVEEIEYLNTNCIVLWEKLM